MTLLRDGGAQLMYSNKTAIGELTDLASSGNVDGVTQVLMG